MKTKYFLAIVFVIAVILSVKSQAFSYDFEVTKQEIQKKLDAKFPIVKKNFFLKTTISNAKINLKDGQNRVFLTCDVKVLILKQYDFDIYVEFDARLHYENSKKEFYMEDLKIQKIQMQDIPEKYHKMIKDNLANLEKGLKVALKKHPVYKIKEKDFLKSSAVSFLKSIKVEDGVMKIEIGF